MPLLHATITYHYYMQLLHAIITIITCVNKGTFIFFGGNKFHANYKGTYWDNLIIGYSIYIFLLFLLFPFCILIFLLILL